MPPTKSVKVVGLYIVITGKKDGRKHFSSIVNKT
jgi:hypothetical protein